MRLRMNSLLRAQSVFVLLCVSLVLYACRANDENIISQKKMIDVYADVLIITSAVEEGEQLRYFEKLDSVLALHRINRKQFEASLDYYQENPQKWKELIDHVIIELERRRDQARDPSATRSSS